MRRRGWYRNSNFYPRSPCGERLNRNLVPSSQYVFLSALSLRRATHLRYSFDQRFAISIHALLAESDHSNIYIVLISNPFLSTLSLRRATKINGCVSLYGTFLSTLSLRRATKALSGVNKQIKFLSTLSLRRATFGDRKAPDNLSISIHALLAESDYR